MGSYKYIHLSDFPKDKIVVFLERKFREKFFDRLIKSFGKKCLANHLKLKKLDTINRWKKAEIKRNKNWITPQGIPLDKLGKLSELIGLDLKNIESYVVAYKSRGKSLWIKNPNLPIKESPELFRIIAHLMGDGSANESSVNYFKNFNKSLLNEFANDVRKVFGNVELSFNKDNIVFPISIRHIFSKFYSIGFGTFNATIPKRLFNLPKEYAKKFIQGFFDDEGNVQTSCVRFYSFNKELIKGIRNLMICKFPEIKPKGIKNRNKISNMEYCFSINAEDLEKFYKLIGCLHPDKKEKLKLYFKRKNRGWNHRKSGDTKTRILKSLKKDSKTIFEISKKLNISRETIRVHLFGYNCKRKKNIKGLIEQDLVKIKKYGKYNAAIYEAIYLN